MLTGIAHCALTVSDMERSLAFYEKVLGIKKAFEIHDDEDRPWIVYLKVAPGQFLELFYGGRPEEHPQSNRAGFNHLCFAVSDIHEIARYITENGGTLTSSVKQGKDGNFQCWTVDPDGNRVELMQMSPDSLQARS